MQAIWKHQETGELIKARIGFFSFGGTSVEALVHIHGVGHYSLAGPAEEFDFWSYL